MSGVAVIACGMATASGLTAPAACAAFRARIENFQETRFISQDGSWIIGAEVPLTTPWRGLARHVHMATGPIQECLAVCAEIPTEQIALLLCLAEGDRAGRLPDLDTEFPKRLVSVLGRKFAPQSKVLAFGQAGGAVAIQEARDLLSQGLVRRVMIASADSFLLAATLSAYDRDDRVLTDENSNGFVAGEAGAAILLGPLGTQGLMLRGIGMAREAAFLGSGEPLRADGMVSCFRSALGEAGIPLSQIDYRIADITGEQYYFKEASLALTRVLRERVEFMDLWTPADCFGHAGAAALPLMVGVAFTAAAKGYAPGPRTLLHAADDDGRRAALIFEWSA